MHTPDIHALCGIRTHDPSFRTSEDSSCLRPLGYCDCRLEGLVEFNSKATYSVPELHSKHECHVNSTKTFSFHQY
jgi:hypothetical protein